MMMPPIVGVPAFAWCPSGPSSRMFWPNSRARRKEMNLGDRNTQMSSEAVPAIRTSPMSGSSRERFGDGLEPDPARGLDKHDVAGADEVRGQRRCLTRARGAVRLALKRRTHLLRQRTDGDEHVNAGRARVLAELAMVGALGRPELEHVAEHGDAPPERLIGGE